MSCLLVLVSIVALAGGVRDDVFNETSVFVDEAIAVATEVYNENFQKTVIGDCDFGVKDKHNSEAIKERANKLCPRSMGNGCTMAQMFIGEPAECGGEFPMRAEGVQSYAALWVNANNGIVVERTLKYQLGTNKGIREAGKLALKSAKAKAKTGDVWYGLGVCTTLAAAGQTAIADKMEADKSKWQGTRIKFVQEEYPEMNDGHEYLIIENAEQTNAVLVDFWYATLEGDTDANIGDLHTLAVEGSKWDQAKMSTPEDGPEGKKKERVYVVGK